MFEDIFKTEPLMINDIGMKFWIDNDTTDYANEKDKNGISLKGVVFFTEDKNGIRTRIFVDENQKILAEETSIEGIAIKIDLLKFLKTQNDDY